MAGLKSELETAMLLITHDLGVVAQTAGRVAVMYAGRVVELAGIQALFNNPLHPYTQGLLRAVPRLGRGRGPLYEISGSVPAATQTMIGCPFAERCPAVFARCRREAPALSDVLDGHRASCWLYSG